MSQPDHCTYEKPNGSGNCTNVTCPKIHPRSNKIPCPGGAKCGLNKPENFCRRVHSATPPSAVPSSSKQCRYESTDPRGCTNLNCTYFHAKPRPTRPTTSSSASAPVPPSTVPSSVSTPLSASVSTSLSASASNFVPSFGRPCHYGAECYGAKSGKCPYVHPPPSGRQFPTRKEYRYVPLAPSTGDCTPYGVGEDIEVVYSGALDLIEDMIDGCYGDKGFVKAEDEALALDEAAFALPDDA